MLNKDLEKCITTTMSCRTTEQFESVLNMNKNFLAKWKLYAKKNKSMMLDVVTSFQDLSILQKKRLHILNEYNLFEGDNVDAV